MIPEIPEHILNAIPHGLLVIRKMDRRILWASNHIREIFPDKKDPVGFRCHEFFFQSSVPCDQTVCPLYNEGKEFFDFQHSPGGAVVKILTSSLDEEHYLCAVTEEGELYRRIKYFGKLLTINRYLHSSLTLDEILSVVLLGITAGEALGFNRAFVFLPDEEENNLIGHLAVGPRDAAEAARIWQEVSTMNLSLEEILKRFPRTLEDNQKLIEHVRKLSYPMSETDHPLIKTYLQGNTLCQVRPPDPFLQEVDSPECVIGAFQHHGISHGVFVADNKFSGKPITSDSLEFLELLIGEAATAISNSVLYQKLHNTVEELKISQEKLIEVERLSALGEVTAAVAHEIRNPIVTLGMILNSHIKTCTSEEKDDLDAMKQTLTGLERLLRDYITFSGKPALKLESLNVSDFIEGIIKFMRLECEEKNVKVSFFPPTDPVQVSWDNMQMQEVFLNLFHNAFGAMPGGGKIIIAAHPVEGDRIRITFSDTGFGIPEHLREKVFKPYFTTKTTGSGIGLTLVSRIIHDHQGHIWVENGESEGTTFILEIPREVES